MRCDPSLAAEHLAALLSLPLVTESIIVFWQHHGSAPLGC
jgi:hypothetical protein